MKKHDAHTEFFDVGIGCGWFAYLGDGEPVCGDSEENALARLAEENGLESWHQPI